MATRFIDKDYGADPLTAIADDEVGVAKVKDLPDAAGIVYDVVDKKIKFNADGSIVTLVDNSDIEVAALDDVTLEYNEGVVQIKAEGVDTAQIADGAVTSDKTEGETLVSFVIGDFELTFTNGLLTGVVDNSG